jgi:hypothetical protein
MRTVIIIAHTGVVISLAGLFFGSLAWAYHSPYGLPMWLGSLVLLILSGVFSWYYGVSPIWRPRGWEERVEYEDRTFLVFTQQYPPYLSLKTKRNSGAQFGTAVYLLHGNEASEDAQALYGMQWQRRHEAEEGHRWIVQTLCAGRLRELEDFRVQPEKV